MTGTANDNSHRGEITWQSKQKSKSKVSFEDLAVIIGLHLPTLRVLYPEVEAELKELGQRNETDLDTLIPKTMQAIETLREINRLVTT